MIPQTAAPPPGTGGVQREMYCSSGFANSTGSFFETAYLHLTFIDKFTWHLVAAALVLPPNGRYATMRTIDQRTLVEKR
jgi:hypothetical protein